MLEDKDIQKIIEANREVFATKEDFEDFQEEINKRFDKLFNVFATKEDLEEAVKNLSTKEDFNKLLTAVDAYAQKADAYFQEMVMLSHKVDRHEKWFHLTFFTYLLTFCLRPSIFSRPWRGLKFSPGYTYIF